MGSDSPTPDVPPQTTSFVKFFQVNTTADSMRFLVFVCLVACLAAVHADIGDQITDGLAQAGDAISGVANQAGTGIKDAANAVKDFTVDRYNNVADCIKDAGDDVSKKALCTTKFVPGSKASGFCGNFMMVFAV